MASHNETGKKGEELAAGWLEESGFILLHRNWRHSHYEIDMIATKNNKIHFIEVKTRSNNRFGFPEESVSDKKIENLMQAAEEFLYRHPEFKNIQYDVLAITLLKNKEPSFFFIEDVYL